jgi:alginate O-acetyltransferase complex protein AlgI
MSAAWLGLCAYALQIYFDFSGYSDMAIGIGRMFGFKFPENFFYPYASRSMREFWRRWHMTLSRFFRDYLYIPLGGNRHGALRTGFNLVLVFGLCGLWHGASWNFLIWGLFHGIFLAGERFFERVAIPAWLRALGHPYVLIVTLLSWVFFRCDTWALSMAYFHSLLLAKAGGGLAVIPWNAIAPNVLYAFYAGVLLCVPSLPAVSAWCSGRRIVRPFVAPCSAVAQLAVLFLCLLAIGSGSHNPFIYYRF